MKITMGERIKQLRKEHNLSNLFGVSPAYLMCFDQWDEGTVSDDVKLIERIQAKWGKSTVKLLNEFLSLNTFFAP